jgi:multidrug efflux system membrane fusion protein
MRVQLIGDAPQGVWVTGLPEKTLLITVGHEYVNDGQQVAVIMDEDHTVSRDTVSASYL